MFASYSTGALKSRGLAMFRMPVALKNVGRLQSELVQIVLCICSSTLEFEPSLVAQACSELVPIEEVLNPMR